MEMPYIYMTRYLIGQMPFVIERFLHSQVLWQYGQQLGIPQGACFYARRRQDILDWGPTIDSMTAVEEFFHLAGQIWDYALEIVDAGMTNDFAALFAGHVVARISDPTEMIPEF